MLSQKMYSVLSEIPLPNEAITYEDLRQKCSDLNTNSFNQLLIQAASSSCNYIFAPSPIENAIIALTEHGVAELETYKVQEENRKITEKTLAVAQKTLTVSKVAMWTTIASAVVAFLALLPQLPTLVSFFQSLFLPVQ